MARRFAAFVRRAPAEPTEPIAAAIRAELAEIDRRAATTDTVPLLTTGLGALAGIYVTNELSFTAALAQSAVPVVADISAADTHRQRRAPH